MKHYIDKDALVAEIKARISCIEVSQKAGMIKKRDADKKIFLLKSVLTLIDTLEVKEVDDEPDCLIFPRPIECYSTCKECPWSVTNNKAQKEE